MVLNTVIATVSSNRRQYIRSAIESTLDGTSIPDHWEVVVAKDFHDDELDSWLERRQCRTVFCRESIGAMYKQSLASSTGEIVAFLDDDDLFMPGKLRTIERRFLENPDIVFYHNAYQCIDEQGLPLRSGHRPPSEYACEIPSEELTLHKALRLAGERRLHNISSMAVRRSSLEPFLPSLDRLKVGTDSCMFVLSAVAGGLLYFDNQILTQYRTSHQSQTHYAKLERGKLVVDEGRRLGSLSDICATMDWLSEIVPNPDLKRFVEVIRSTARMKAYVVRDGLRHPALEVKDLANSLSHLVHDPRTEGAVDLGLAALSSLCQPCSVSVLSKLLPFRQD